VKRHARFVIPALIVVAALGGLLFFFIEDALVYFRTPTDVVEETAADGSRMRLGGQVEVGSVVENTAGVDFVVTDGANAVEVSHTGSPAQLFAEGRGIVVEGTWDGARFHSDTMIIKHDEQYRTEDGDVYEPGEYPTGES
jgi:cytochrome c-type biogenesis protein CcmE